jgi:phenylacetate-coenzyme A ligase PaaK-like adenylate-forming protein
MNKLQSFKKDLFNINIENFEEKAFALFQYQARNNYVYNLYLKTLGKDPASIKNLEEIPFLPIDFFKHHRAVTNEWQPQLIFESSGTGNQTPSRHFIEDPSFYFKVAKNIFSHFFGNLKDFHILALLPSYLERHNSSLVEMVSYFIKETNSNQSGFYLHNTNDLLKNLELLKNTEKKTMLIGVTFALLDLAQEHQLDLSQVMLMETGGMKGRREEMIRKEVHQILKSRFNLTAVHSEYGMTELLSQAYALEEGKFRTPPWLKIMIRDLNDPFTFLESNRNGGINIIDLANIHSCAFIETSDIGLISNDGTFEVLGRFDNSDIRGCNLMVV